MIINTIIIYIATATLQGVLNLTTALEYRNTTGRSAKRTKGVRYIVLHQITPLHMSFFAFLLTCFYPCCLLVAYL